ncbi:MAG: hypothetical protein ACR2PR_09395 [Pseudohongiellaceae bacterium]
MPGNPYNTPGAITGARPFLYAVGAAERGDLRSIEYRQPVFDKKGWCGEINRTESGGVEARAYVPAGWYSRAVKDNRSALLIIAAAHKRYGKRIQKRTADDCRPVASHSERWKTTYAHHNNA